MSLASILKIGAALMVAAPLLSLGNMALAQSAQTRAPMVVADNANPDANLTPEEIAKRKAKLLKKGQQDNGGKPAGGTTGGGAPATDLKNAKKPVGTSPGSPATGGASGTAAEGTGQGTGGAANGNKKNLKALTTTAPASTLQAAPGTAGGSTGTAATGTGDTTQPDVLDAKHKKHLKTVTAPATTLQTAPGAAGGSTGTATGTAATGGLTGSQPDLLDAQHKKHLKAMIPAGGTPATGAGTQLTTMTLPLPKLGTPAGHIQDLQQGRTQHTEEGGNRTVITEPGNRVIIQQGSQTIIHHDDGARFADGAKSVKTVQGGNGITINVFNRSGGITIYNETAPDGRLMRRYRRDHDGHEVNLIDNREFFRDAAAVGIGALVVAAVLDLPPPEIHIPRERYEVEYDRASDDDLRQCLLAPPVERLERRYSLQEVLYTHELRERMPHIDLDTITFETGSWSVDPQEYTLLQRVADAMKYVVGRHPAEVFLIEGHTDAVGSDIDNLSLSDRRAEEVARVLTEVFAVPPENMVTQGYGKQFLKVDTLGPERANRRVVVRRITPLMAGQ